MYFLKVSLSTKCAVNLRISASFFGVAMPSACLFGIGLVSRILSKSRIFWRYASFTWIGLPLKKKCLLTFSIFQFWRLINWSKKTISIKWLWYVIFTSSLLSGSQRFQHFAISYSILSSAHQIDPLLHNLQ